MMSIIDSEIKLLKTFMIEYKKFPVEKILFYVILLSNVVLVFATRYFPALDSPSHLYNAQIIKELLFHKQSTLDLFFSIKLIYSCN